MESKPLWLLSQKLRVPAGIIHAIFPLLCWVLLIFRWKGYWLTEPWMVAVIVVYYVFAAAYLFFMYTTRVQVFAIVGLFLALIASLFMWIPYHWFLAELMVPALFMAFYNRKKTYTAATAFTVIVGVIAAIVIGIALLTRSLGPEQYTYYPSPDGRYVALERGTQSIGGKDDVLLCRVEGPLLVSERTIYRGLKADFGGNIEWLDQNMILIYGEKMDPFKDNAIIRRVEG